MSTIDRIMETVRVRVPGALDQMIKHELFAVFDEFFDNTNIWKEEFDFTTVASRTEYEITPDDHAQVLRLMGVTKDTIPIKASLKTEPSLILLATEPQAGWGMTATVALTVLDPVDADELPQVPDWIIVKYWRGIADGVIAKLLSQPAKPYTNINLATYHQQRFRQAMAKAKAEANSENLYGGQRWAFPQNFATGR